MLWLFSGISFAAILGTNTATESVSFERIARLSKSERRQWEQYLKQSLTQRKTDQAFFRAEMKKHGLRQATSPTEQRGVRGIPLDRRGEWYASDEALRLAENIISFQTPAGGWTKNVDIASSPRQPGERFAAGNLSNYPGSLDFDVPEDENWNYVGTFDNDATTTQLEFLARVIKARGEAAGSPQRQAFTKGLEYVFSAQYPNGGWPQVWPLQGGYHDAITYNDGAMTHILVLLNKVASGGDDYAFVSASLRAKARHSVERGIQCVLSTQIRANGRRTVWCQQHDALTLAPCSARNYEMPCQASSESADLVLFLMDLTKPDPAAASAIRSAADWFDKTKISDVEYTRGGSELVAAPDQGPLWARYSEIGTDRPIFGDRDKTIHDRLDEISAERRRGYGWYRDTGREVIERYEKWKGGK
jgi:PelA/Pel-15E family pectate lyase